MKINKLLKKEFFDRWQKELKKLSRQTIRHHFAYDAPVYEQVGEAIYRALPNGEKEFVEEVLTTGNTSPENPHD